MNELWIEKYRSESLQDMVINDTYKKKFEEYISKSEIPHILLMGEPGTGKTTIALILINAIIKSKVDILRINGSTLRGIDVIRTYVSEFAAYSPALSNIKIVFIDECDQLTEDAQKALRGIIEANAADTRFLMTGNYRHKIEKAILSRMQTFTFEALPRENMLSLCKQILDGESITYNEKDIQSIINLYYPDLRSITNTLHQLTLFNDDDSRELHIAQDGNAIIELSILQLCINLLNSYNNQQAFNTLSEKLLKLISHKNIDYILVYNRLFDTLHGTEKFIIGEYCNKHDKVISQRMNFYCALINIINRRQMQNGSS